ncbi:MAG TPA: hypothetical protein VJK53_02305 [Candidatus Paceibacterota bacterium]
MHKKYGIAEGILDFIVVFLVIYPLAVARTIFLVCPTLDLCGPFVDSILRPAAFMSFLLVFGVYTLIPIGLVSMFVSAGFKIRRYAQNGYSLFRILYSIPFIALVVITATFLL